jgi:hypothetical protein
MTAELFKDNKEAQYAFQILKSTNRPVFLTGRAGTGKSTFIEWARTITEKCIVLAPTGISALNIGGKTIHSVFNLPDRFIYPDDYRFFAMQKFKSEKKEEIRQSELIIIDEISMVNSSIMFCMDQILKKLCGTRQIFGGKKILLIGDPFQLAPVIPSEGNIKADLKSYFGGEYFFDSQLFKESDPIKIELKIIYRQKDPKFCEILNDIREGINLRKATSAINEIWYRRHFNKDCEEKPPGICLTFTNKAAKGINDASLNNLPGNEFEFKASIWGDFDIKSTLIEDMLKVKVGAEVMCIKNHPNGKFVNGTIGIVRAIENEAISIEDSAGNLIPVKKATWLNEQKVYTKITNPKREKIELVGTCKQFPIRLGWAITVHKSQGLTFDNIFFQNSGFVFANSLIYVALSRCTTLEGIELATPISASDIRIDKRIHEFNKKLTSREDLDGLMTEIYDEIALQSLPTQFNFEEIEISVVQNKLTLLNNSICDLIERLKLNNWIVEEGPNQYMRIDQNDVEIDSVKSTE